MEARRRYEPQGVGFLAVSIASDRAWTETAVRRWGFDLPQAHTTGNLLLALEITDVPATILVSPEGRLIGRSTRPRDEAWFLEAGARLAGLVN